MISPGDKQYVGCWEALATRFSSFKRPIKSNKNAREEQRFRSSSVAQMIPPRMGTALGPVDYSARKPVPKDWVLRGSGIHGPENGEVACRGLSK